MSLREVLLDELKDLYSAENQLVKYLPKAAKGAETSELKQIFLTHLDETKEQVERLKQIFGILGKKATGKHCSGMEGAIDEVKEALDEETQGAVFDAGIFGGALRVEHYEIAGYSAAIMISSALGEGEIVTMLKQTLAEEQNTAKQLMAAAKGILKKAYAEEPDDKNKPEKKPKDAKEKLSEAESKKDEADAKQGLSKSARESMEAEPDKDDEEAKSEEEMEDSEKDAKKSAAEKATAKKAAKKKSKK